MSEAPEQIEAVATESGNMLSAYEKGGRPTDYTPERGEEVIGWMRQGYSLTAAAGAMGFSRQTLVNWTKRHPEFFEAVTRAKAMRTFKLEQDMLSTESGPVVNRCRFALVNAAPEDWREKQDVNLGTQKDDPLARFLDSLANTTVHPKETTNAKDIEDDEEAPGFGEDEAEQA